MHTFGINQCLNVIGSIQEVAGKHIIEILVVNGLKSILIQGIGQSS